MRNKKKTNVKVVFILSEQSVKVATALEISAHQLTQLTGMLTNSGDVLASRGSKEILTDIQVIDKFTQLQKKHYFE
jgi:hypothetical protein